MKNTKIKCSDHGFTLVELMVAVVISTIVAAAIFAAYQNQQKLYKRQEAVIDMQQNARAGLYLISQELRMAGYDPTDIGGVGIQTANATTLQYTQDLNENNAIDPGETVTLTYNAPVAPDPGNITRNNGAGAQPFLNNIDFLEMVYTLDDGTDHLVPPGGALNRIESIQLSMLVRSSISEPDFANTLPYVTPPPFNTDATGGVPFNDGFRRRLITTTIQLRNASL